MNSLGSENLIKRRSAGKSRHGCKECKQRHLKCDETTPSCANCKVRHLQCSYLSSLPISRKSTSSATPSSSLSVASESSQSGQAVIREVTPIRCPGHTTYGPVTASSHDRPTLLAELPYPAEPTFKLHHLELLHNFRAGFLEDIFRDHAAAEGCMAMAVDEAVRAPYVMDQMLAISAANMSIRRPHQRDFYQEEATHLQTRGLALFSAARASEATDNILAGFIFSTILSQHVLFDTFATRADFSIFLDRLTASLHICGGVRVMTKMSWPFIRTEYQRQIGANLREESRDGASHETMLAAQLTKLESLLHGEALDPSIMDPCIVALGQLRNLSHVPELPSDSVFRATRILQLRVLEWAIHIPTDFVRLLEQRRPEALVITAYFVLLIHETRDCWLYGDAGAFAIRSITKFLGRYWAAWLAWPNEVLDSVNRAAEETSCFEIDTSKAYRVDDVS